MVGKYVIVDKNGLPVPILFDDLLRHCDVAAGVGKVISAGMFRPLDNGGFHCWGESTSLGGIRSRDIDSAILNEWFRKMMDPTYS